MLTDKEKLEKYDWAVYIIEELLKVDLIDGFPSDWKESSFHIFRRATAVRYAEILYMLTGNEKWNKDLEEIRSEVGN